MSKAKRSPSRVRCSAVGANDPGETSANLLTIVHLRPRITKRLGREGDTMPTCRATWLDEPLTEARNKVGWRVSIGAPGPR